MLLHNSLDKSGSIADCHSDGLATGLTQECAGAFIVFLRALNTVSSGASSRPQRYVRWPQGDGL